MKHKLYSETSTQGVFTATPQIITPVFEPFVQNLYSEDHFLKEFGGLFSPGFADMELIKTKQSQIVELLESHFSKFEYILERDLDIHKANTDHEWGMVHAQFMKSLESTVADDIFGFTKQKLANSIMKAVDVMVLEMRGLAIDASNFWMKFYLKEIWLMHELGVNEYSTFTLFIYEQLQILVSHKMVGVKHQKVATRLDRFLRTMVQKCGLVILGISFDFKNKIKTLLHQLNNNMSSCQMMTPYIARLELSKLKKKIQELQSMYPNELYIIRFSDSNLRYSFFKQLYENLDNSPDFDYSRIDESIVLPVPEEIATLVKGDGFAKLLGDCKLENQGEDEKMLLQELLGILPTLLPQSPEEQAINAFLSRHQGLNQRRKTKSKKLLDMLEHKKIVEFQFLVNPEGSIAHLVRFEGETEFHLIKTDADGNQMITKQASETKWYKVDTTVSQSTSIKALRVIAANPSKMIFNEESIKTEALNAGSGALGEFLFKLAEGRKPISALSKDFFMKAGSSLAVNLLIKASPELAVVTAWAVGVKTINDLYQNKLLKNDKKVKMLVDIFARTGTNIGVTIGSAIVGQALIPIPILGGFIGGVIGGFSVAALFHTYDKLVSKKVSLELLFLYICLKFHLFGAWSDEKLTPETFQGLEQLIKEFLRNLWSFFIVKHDETTFIKELIHKQNDMLEIVEEMYAKTAEKLKNQVIDFEYQRSWKTAVTYAYISYYYYLTEIKLKSLVDVGEMNEDIFLETVETFESFVNFDPVVEMITHTEINLHASQETIQKVAEEVNRMMDAHQLVTLYKLEDKKHKKDPIELGEKTSRSRKGSFSINQDLELKHNDSDGTPLAPKSPRGEHLKHGTHVEHKHGMHLSAPATPAHLQGQMENKYPAAGESTAKSSDAPRKKSGFSLWPF